MISLNSPINGNLNRQNVYGTVTAHFIICSYVTMHYKLAKAIPLIGSWMTGYLHRMLLKMLFTDVLG